MVRVSFTPGIRVTHPDAMSFGPIREYCCEFETTSYRLLDTEDSPTEYDESVHTLKIGTDIKYVAIKVKATNR